MIGPDEVVVHQDPDAGAMAAPDAAGVPMIDDASGDIKADDVPADFPANARPVGDGSFILKLAYPVSLKFRQADGKITEERYGELHLKRLNGRTHREIRQASDEDIRPQMLASSIGITLGRARLLHDVMDAADISAAIRVVSFFIAPGPRTGRSS